MSRVAWRDFLAGLETVAPTAFVMTLPRRLDDPEWASADRGLMRVFAVLGRRGVVGRDDSEGEYRCVAARPATMHDH